MNDYRAYVMYDYNSIYHHGIKGQRWGIRRFQNEDGSLTPAGQKRYGKLVDRYKKAGMTDEQITQALQKRRKMETALKIGVGALVVGTAAYMAYRHLGGKYVDKTIKAGTKMNTLTNHPEYLEKGHFFVSQGKHDNDRYLAMFGENKNIFGQSAGLKKRVVNEAAKDIKVASEKSQVEAFTKLLKNDKDFAKDVVNNTGTLSAAEMVMRKMGPQARGSILLDKLKKGTKSIDDLSNKEIKELHTLFDLNMVDHKNNADAQRKYFDALRQMGYGGKVDINDSQYSGFFTKSATILFDNKDLMNTKIEDIKRSEHAVAIGKDGVNQLVEQVAIPFSSLGVAYYGQKAIRAQDEKTIREAGRKQRNNNRK